MKRPWLYYFSPCIIAAVICLVGIIAALNKLNGPHGIGFYFLIILGPAFFLLMGASYVIKKIANGNVSHIWMTELILIAIAVFLLMVVLR